MSTIYTGDDYNNSEYWLWNGISPFDMLNAATAAKVADLLAAIAARSDGTGSDAGQIVWPTAPAQLGGYNPTVGTSVTTRPVPIYGNAFYVDGSTGTQALVGTAALNVINTQKAAGSDQLVVDLTHGFVVKGNRLDATLENIQGVQLGAGVSVVLGLSAGTDLVYGGSGTNNVFGNGANDVFRGGGGTNLFMGGSGNEIFYSGNGANTMHGGSACNFMQGGSTANSSDTFIGNGGNDFVYGEGGSITLQGGSGTEVLHGGAGTNTLIGTTQADGQGRTGTNIFYGGTGSAAGTDIDYAGIGVNLMYEGSGLSVFAGNAGTDYIYGGSGRSFVYGGSGTDVITTGAGNQYVKAGSGLTFFNDTAANLHAGRFDQIDNFSGGRGTEIYLPTAVKDATSFVSQNGGTAILTNVGPGTAQLFVSHATVANVLAHTHFTL